MADDMKGKMEEVRKLEEQRAKHKKSMSEVDLSEGEFIIGDESEPVTKGGPTKGGYIEDDEIIMEDDIEIPESEQAKWDKIKDDVQQDIMDVMKGHWATEWEKIMPNVQQEIMEVMQQQWAFQWQQMQMGMMRQMQMQMQPQLQMEPPKKKKGMDISDLR